MSFHIAIEKASSKEKIFISERDKTGNSVLGNAFGRNFPFRHQAAGFGVEMRARHLVGGPLEPMGIWLVAKCGD
jgi:hypothetical protein